MTPWAEPLYALRAVTKTYGAVEALRGIDLNVFAGEILAICGDNGAGKSTLIKIMSGAEEPTSGTLRLKGRDIRFHTPQDALHRGVATIYQDLALAPRLSIAANVFLGAEHLRSIGLPFFKMLDKARMAREAQGYLERLSVKIADVSRPVERLSGGQRQAVAIARALRWNADVIIMDEPTAALGVKETAQVLDLIRHLKSEGRTVILISHNMRDVVALATRIAILKGGRKVHELVNDGLTPDDVSRLIMSAPEAA